ncbi:MAG: winged helix-turn-helix transcriptional regulator [Rhodospirillales bacterium]|nr:winged helix-turn-helix transcriptional regulator [Rhodospirillales bacterium]
MTRRPSPADPPDYAALAAFRRALRGFTDFSERAARGAGLSPRQHQALLAIKGAPAPPTIGALAEALVIRPHSAVELVDRLTQLRLVERRADPADLRRARLALTERAETILRALSEAHLAELRAIRPSLIALLERFAPGAPT